MALWRAGGLFVALALLAACGVTPSGMAALPTASLRLVTPAAVVQPAGAPALPASSEPAITPVLVAAALPTAAPEPPCPGVETDCSPLLAQYRRWMDEARALHPYAEPLDHMWAVMLCESSGQAEVVAGENYGLFQYSQATWAGEWNTYRDQPILDARAQIFATAKAWHDGSQAWWSCY